jgi:hypothetical protein
MVTTMPTNMADVAKRPGAEIGALKKSHRRPSRVVSRGPRQAICPSSDRVGSKLVINLKTATALGLDAPPMLLARADEVIEGSGAISSRCSAARRLRGRSRLAPSNKQHQSPAS